MGKYFVVVFSLCLSLLASGQRPLPVIRANSKIASLREGDVFKKNEWTITPEARPDIWGVPADKIDGTQATLITDIDSITFHVELNQKYDFIVLLNGKDSAYTEIQGVPTAATFTDEYIKKMNHRTTVEITPMYELVNIVIALTNFEIKDSGQVIHSTPYYAEMRKWFDPYKDDPIVLTFDSLLNQEIWNYFFLKMDGYSLEISSNKISHSDIYDRTGWQSKNYLTPYVDALEKFAQRSNFQKFYNDHKILYDDQISYVKDSLDTDGMHLWLTRNFPGTDYNCLKVLFSPLVGYSQSENRIKSRGFEEVHVHVNFPYPSDEENNISESARNIDRGDILFTEYNHAYINPEAEKYSNNPDFVKAFANLSFWEEPNSSATMGYTKSLTCFEEYMNWGLVCLRYVDLLNTEEQNYLIPRIDRMMKESRGFSKFPEFDAMLIELYKNRKQDQTLADLYPAILKWCSSQVK